MGLEEYASSLNLTPYPRPMPLDEWSRADACDELLRFLLRERGLIAAFSVSYARRRQLVRENMTRRPALPAPPDILAVQDRLFWTETLERGVVQPDGLTFGKYDIALWQGDITRLAVDAIVNAGNKSLLGCNIPGHNCIDNIIHSAAGMQLRSDCRRIISAIGHETCGNARITRAYNLPSKYVIHTVGPMIGRTIEETARMQLRSCYISCLNTVEEMNLHSIAFCCIATGVFNFPHDEAAEIATGAVLSWKLRHPDYPLKVIFDTFREEDTSIYRNILNMM